MKRATFWATVAGFGFLMGAISGTIAAKITGQVDSISYQSSQFQSIEQPLSTKILVTIGGIFFISLELWWFLLNRPRSTQATVQGDVQSVTVTVDGGYEPSHIIVQAGRAVQLNFDRQDPSSCLEEVRLPDFHIAKKLILHQITQIELMPEKPGRYEFSCSMNMFRGVIEVQA